MVPYLRFVRAIVLLATPSAACASTVDPYGCPANTVVGDRTPCTHIGMTCEYDGGCEPNCVCGATGPDGGAVWSCGIRCGGPLLPPELCDV